MVRDKVRIRFSKAGSLRFISHHDLMRCFERMLRRAALPFHSTQGFNPKPRLVFAAPLPLGMVGRREVADLELDEVVATEEIQSRLAGESPAGLQILQVLRIDPGTTARVRYVTYRVPLSGADIPHDLPDRLLSLQAAAECWIDRTRPQQRRIDLRPYIMDLRLQPNALEMDLLVTPQGTARPDEILGSLGLTAILDEGVVIERTAVELAEEESSAFVRGTASLASKGDVHRWEAGN
jgi:radical SAM-linked protein